MNESVPEAIAEHVASSLVSKYKDDGQTHVLYIIQDTLIFTKLVDSINRKWMVIKDSANCSDIPLGAYYLKLHRASLDSFVNDNFQACYFEFLLEKKIKIGFVSSEGIYEYRLENGKSGKELFFIGGMSDVRLITVD